MAYINLESSIISDSREILDRKLVLTKAEMLSGNYSDSGEKIMLPNSKSVPQYLITFCPDDSSFYMYHAKNTASAETGKFKKVDLASSESVKSGTTAEMNAATSTSNLGDKWLNSDDGKLYELAEDESGNKSWVPAPVSQGDMIYDATAKQMKYYDGEAWQPIGVGGTAGAAAVKSGDASEMPTSTATKGDKYLVTSGSGVGRLMEYNGSSWSELPKTAGDLVYDMGEGTIKYYNGYGWYPLDGKDHHATNAGSTDEMNDHLNTSNPGDKWLNSDNDTLYESVTNPDGTKQWKPAIVKPGDTVYDPNSKEIKYFNGSSWVSMGGSVQLADDSLTMVTEGEHPGLKVTREFFFGYDEPDPSLGKPGDIYFMAISD